MEKIIECAVVFVRWLVLYTMATLALGWSIKLFLGYSLKATPLGAVPLLLWSGVWTLAGTWVLYWRVQRIRKAFIFALRDTEPVPDQPADER